MACGLAGLFRRTRAFRPPRGVQRSRDRHGRSLYTPRCARVWTFSIVTSGKAWEPMLQEFAASIALADRLASIRPTTATGGEILRDPQAALAQLATEVETCRKDGAQRVILGGTGLAGPALRLRPLVRVPILDCVEALAVTTCEAVTADLAAGLTTRPSPLAGKLIEDGWMAAREPRRPARWCYRAPFSSA